SFYSYDGHGNVRFLANTAASTTDSYDFDAFGMPIRTSGTTPNQFLYSGERYDSSIGLYDLRARYYNQATGRLWERDPEDGEICSPLTQNPYIYATDNPINAVDPTGRQAIVEYLLLIHFIKPIPPTFRPCFAQLKYRYARLGCNHAFWWIQTPSGQRYTISGGPDKGSLETLARNSYLNVWPTPGDVNAKFPKDNSGDAVAFDSGTSFAVCGQVLALLSAARHYQNGTIPYRAPAGPDSNTIAHWLGTQGGFSPSAPP